MSQFGGARLAAPLFSAPRARILGEKLDEKEVHFMCTLQKIVVVPCFAHVAHCFVFLQLTVSFLSDLHSFRDPRI